MPYKGRPEWFKEYEAERERMAREQELRDHIRGLESSVSKVKDQNRLLRWMLLALAVVVIVLSIHHPDSILSTVHLMIAARDHQ